MQPQLAKPQQYSPGLEGVIAGETTISELDGHTGHLSYRGYHIEDLAARSNYEETAYLLLYGKLPTLDELEEFKKFLHRERKIPPKTIHALRELPRRTHPMDALRTGVSLLGAYDPDYGNETRDANLRKAERLIAKTPTLIADHWRVSHGMKTITPSPRLSRAKNFLYMLTGRMPREEDADVFDKSLVLYAEHEFNASTFSARVTISSLSDMHSAITSAIGTLKGPLHGGANEEALKMLLGIGPRGNAEAFVMGALAKKHKIMGFGHRVYKTFDMRARILKKLATQLAKRKPKQAWLLAKQQTIEDVLKREKNLFPNVDFYSASVYYMLGLAPQLYTPVFAMARTAGWAAHVIEQLDNNRIIRPKGLYIGAKKKVYVPIEKRG